MQQCGDARLSEGNDVGLANSDVSYLGGATEADATEEWRLRAQGDVYAALATWTLDSLGIGPGSRVLEVGGGGGALLAAAAERVGPTGRVVGVDRIGNLVASARERMAAYPWVEVVEGDFSADALAGAQFDAVHCRLVLMHQRDTDAFLARMVGLTRPGGKVGAQEYDISPLICHPPLPALARMDFGARAGVALTGMDIEAGRKLLDRFCRAGLTAVRVEACAPVTPLTDPRVEVVLATWGGFGPLVERAGAMSAAAFDGVVAEVRAAHRNPGSGHHLLQFPAIIAAVGRVPGA